MLRVMAVTFLAAATFAASPALAQTTAWSALTVSDPAKSAGTKLASADGKSWLIVKCDFGDDVKNLTIQFVPRTSIGLGGRPKLQIEGRGADSFPFLVAWTLVPGRAAYIDSYSNELPEALAAMFAAGGMELAVIATDAQGGPLHEAFKFEQDTSGEIDRVFRKCRGKGLNDYLPLERKWRLESSKTPEGSPMYTAVLSSVDDRARLGIRCTYTGDDMVLSMIVEAKEGYVPLLSAPEIMIGDTVIPMDFKKIGTGEWEWGGDTMLFNLIDLLLHEDAPIVLRRTQAESPAGTMFMSMKQDGREVIREAANMCNIPL